MVKWYKSMTLLNTMDKILYESQRQVRVPALSWSGKRHFFSRIHNYIPVYSRVGNKQKTVLVLAAPILLALTLASAVTGT